MGWPVGGPWVARGWSVGGRGWPVGGPWVAVGLPWGPWEGFKQRIMLEVSNKHPKMENEKNQISKQNIYKIKQV